MATVARSPLAVFRTPAKVLPVAVVATAAVNLLLNTLLVQIPSGTAARRSLDLPPRAAPHPVDNRTWIQDTPIQLIGKDTFFNDPGRGPNNVHQNPIIAKATVPNGFTSDGIRSAVVTPNPFFGSALELPRKIDYRYDLISGQFLGQDKFFTDWGRGPDNFEWIVPKGKPFPVANLSWVQSTNLLLNQPAGPAPFKQTDWQNPWGKIPGSGWTQASPVYSIPFKQTDWQNPTLRKGKEPETWVQNLQEVPFFIPPAPPFRPADLPNPRGPQYPTDLRTHITTYTDLTVVPPVETGPSAWWRRWNNRHQPERPSIDWMESLFEIPEVAQEQIVELKKEIKQVRKEVNKKKSVGLNIEDLVRQSKALDSRIEELEKLIKQFNQLNIELPRFKIEKESGKWDFDEVPEEPQVRTFTVYLEDLDIEIEYETTAKELTPEMIQKIRKIVKMAKLAGVGDV